MKKYIYLSIVIVLIYVFQSFFNATGGIGPDSLSYFGIASDLPRLETNLFPLGFPVVIRFFYEIFGGWVVISLYFLFSGHIFQVGEISYRDLALLTILASLFTAFPMFESVNLMKYISPCR